MPVETIVKIAVFFFDFFILILCENAYGCFTYMAQPDTLHNITSEWVGLAKLGSAASKEKIHQSSWRSSTTAVISAKVR